MKLSQKIALLATVPVVVVIGVSLATLLLKQKAIRRELEHTVNEQSLFEARKIAHEVYLLCGRTDAQIDRQAQADLARARASLASAGPWSRDAEAPAWSGLNPDTKQKGTFNLPRLQPAPAAPLAGNAIAAPSPFEQTLAAQTGAACTIFQPAGNTGDWVATGSSLADLATPAATLFFSGSAPESAAGLLARAAQRREPVAGRIRLGAQVHSGTALPLLDAAGQVAGVLYVSRDLAAAQRELREMIAQRTVGKTGYVFVLGAVGEDKGRYIVSRNNARNGESLWEAKDSDGRLFIQSIVAKGLIASGGNTEVEFYPWQNPGESNVRMKLAALTRYEPWQWVIGASTYEDDYSGLFDNVRTSQQSLLVTTAGVAGVLALITAVLALLFSRVLVRALLAVRDGIVAIAQGDFRDRTLATTADETGEMAAALATAIRGVRTAVGAEKIDWAVIARQREEVDRLMCVIENAPANILVAGLDLKIVYANPASHHAYRRLRAHLAQAGDNLLGLSADFFSSADGALRAKLGRRENLPYEAQYQVGPETLSLMASPILDQQGHYLGPMIIWELVTEKIAAAEREKAAYARMQQTMEAINGNSQTLAAAAEELSATAKTMHENTELTSSQSQAATASAEAVGRNISTVAAGAEEMSASIRNIAQSTADASREGASAVQAATATTLTMNQLDASSSQIGQVINLIKSIAEQTNLLALNATIEAARAGESGKGFAVVANEVKALAQQSAKASEDISAKIGLIQQDTRNAVGAINGIADIITKINALQNSVATAIEQQAAATNEIARNAADAARGSQDISTRLTELNEVARHSQEGANNTLQAASELAEMAARLRQIADQGAGKE